MAMTQPAECNAAETVRKVTTKLPAAYDEAAPGAFRLLQKSFSSPLSAHSAAFFRSVQTSGSAHSTMRDLSAPSPWLGAVCFPAKYMRLFDRRSWARIP